VTTLEEDLKHLKATQERPSDGDLQGQVRRDEREERELVLLFQDSFQAFRCF